MPLGTIASHSLVLAGMAAVGRSTSGTTRATDSWSRGSPSAGESWLLKGPMRASDWDAVTGAWSGWGFRGPGVACWLQTPRLRKRRRSGAKCRAAPFGKSSSFCPSKYSVTCCASDLFRDARRQWCNRGGALHRCSPRLGRHVLPILLRTFIPVSVIPIPVRVRSSSSTRD